MGMFTPAIHGVEIEGLGDVEGQGKAKLALDKLQDKLPAATLNLLEGLKVTVGNNLIESGAQTDAEAGTIVLDKDKNSLSLQKAEEYLVEAGILAKGDWTKVLTEYKDQAWSCLTYQLVHEIGHVIDGRATGKKYARLDSSLSPTKYGKSNSSESFAEAFTYWIFDTPLESAANEAILGAIGKKTG